MCSSYYFSSVTLSQLLHKIGLYYFYFALIGWEIILFKDCKELKNWLLRHGSEIDKSISVSDFADTGRGIKLDKECYSYNPLLKINGYGLISGPKILSENIEILQLMSNSDQKESDEIIIIEYSSVRVKF